MREQFWIEKVGSSILIHGVEGAQKPIKIPSAMYPMPKREPVSFLRDNTVPCDDERVRAIFDSLPFRIGRCYDNAKILYDALTQAGIEGVDTYAGWIFIGDNQPAYHCFVVVNGNELLDPTAINYCAFPAPPVGISEEDKRRMFVEYVKNEQRKTKSESSIFGQVFLGHWYFAARCAPAEAKKTFEKLRKAYPKHPAILPTNTENRTPIQEKLMT